MTNTANLSSCAYLAMLEQVMRMANTNTETCLSTKWNEVRLCSLIQR